MVAALYAPIEADGKIPIDPGSAGENAKGQVFALSTNSPLKISIPFAIINKFSLTISLPPSGG